VKGEGNPHASYEHMLEGKSKRETIRIRVFSSTWKKGKRKTRPRSRKVKKERRTLREILLYHKKSLIYSGGTHTFPLKEEETWSI